MSELLPCPFCGSENIVTTDFGASTWFVQCDDCGATFPHFDTETEAIAAWNRRAQQQPRWVPVKERLPERRMSMERLTKKTKNGYGRNCDGCPTKGKCFDAENCVEVLVDRLAAYEDTGLAPERCAELAQAEREGRLVVLPCKVGDTVYLVLPKCRASRIPLAECSFFECDDCPRNKREIFEQKATTEMLSIMLFEKYNTLYVFGKTVFLTRAEAEAALKEVDRERD